MSEERAPIKTLLLSTVLYMPLCFFIWFYISGFLVIPVKWLLEFVFSFWQPDLFNGVSQFKYVFNVETLIFPSQTFAGQNDKLAVLDVTVNPMIYGYGLAVISGLVLSLYTLNKTQKAIQIISGYILVVLIQTFGCFWETIKHLMLNAGPDAQQAIIDTGMNANVMALFYQMSYLIFPAVLPIALWIIMNRNFIGEITGFQTGSDRNFNS